MELSNEEVTEAIDYHQEMIRHLRRRLRERELQEAQLGSGAEPVVKVEIRELTGRIKQHETELEKLQARSVQDKLSLPEADYRILLAELWNTSTGRPTALGTARLERERLRMGLSSERAQELETAVRAALVEETLLRLDTRSLGDWTMLDDMQSSQIEACRQILKAFRLAPVVAASILGGQLPPVARTNLVKFASRYSLAISLDERQRFMGFLEILGEELILVRKEETAKPKAQRKSRAAPPSKETAPS
jgi:hypothetical protein